MGHDFFQIFLYLAHMVGTRIGKKNNKSEKKSCLLIFDRSAQIHPDISDTCGFDALFFYCHKKGLINLEAHFMTSLSANLRTVFGITF